MKRYLIFSNLFAAFVLLTKSSFLQLEEDSKNYVPLAEAALFVIRLYISGETNTLVIMEYSEIAEHQFYNRVLLDHIIKNERSVKFQLFLGQTEERPWNYNIFIVDSSSAFFELGLRIPKNVYEREFHFLIILTNAGRNEGTTRKIMGEIFGMCWSLNVINVVVMIENSPGRVEFFTYKLFSPQGCFDVDPILINRFEEGHLEHDVLFPIALQNFFNCSFRLAAKELPPILGFNGDTENQQHLNDTTKRLTGIDGDILNELGKSLNFSINKLSFPVGRSGFRDGSYSAACFEQLEQGETDIAIGGLNAGHPHRGQLSSTLVYHESPIYFLVRSDRHFGPLAQLISPFSVYVWTMVIVIVAFSLLVIRAINFYGQKARSLFYGGDNSTPMTNVFATLLGYPIAPSPRRNLARYLLMLWLLSTFVLRNAYQGALFDSFRFNRNIPVPRTILELQERNYYLLTDRYYHYYSSNFTILIPTKYANRFDLLSQSHGKFTIVAFFESLILYNENKRDASKLVAVDECILHHPMSIYLQKHSVLRLPFDRKLKQMINSGLTTRIINRYMWFNAMESKTRDLPVITTDLLLGLNYIYIFLILMATLVFALEMLSLKYHQLRKFFRWVHSN